MILELLLRLGAVWLSFSVIDWLTSVIRDMAPVGFEQIEEDDGDDSSSSSERGRRRRRTRRASETSQSSNETGSHLTKEEQKAVSKLYRLLNLEDWDALVSALRSYEPWILDLAEDPVDRDSSFIHVLSQRPDVPSRVFDTLLEKKPDMALLKNDLDQLPLHLVIQTFPTRSDVVRCLVEAAPESVFERDGQLMRPIDILCQTIIMKEERIKYSHDSHEQQDVVSELWESARMLAEKACPSSSFSEPQPMIHACLRARDFPLALTERAIKRNLEQLKERDSNGDLPIHIAARTLPSLDGGDDFLGEIVGLWPQGASKGDKNREIPLELAIHSGRRWTTGISTLIQAYPGGIVGQQQLGLSHYSLIFEKLLREDKKQTVFGILQAKPELFSEM